MRRSSHTAKCSSVFAWGSGPNPPASPELFQECPVLFNRRRSGPESGGDRDFQHGLLGRDVRKYLRKTGTPAVTLVAHPSQVCSASHAQASMSPPLTQTADRYLRSVPGDWEGAAKQRPARGGVTRICDGRGRRVSQLQWLRGTHSATSCEHQAWLGQECARTQSS
jgi:hypothetical protein